MITRNTVYECMPKNRHERYMAAYWETIQVFEKHKLSNLDGIALLASLQYVAIMRSFESQEKP